jgi:plastocyanin
MVIVGKKHLAGAVSAVVVAGALMVACGGGDDSPTAPSGGGGTGGGGGSSNTTTITISNNTVTPNDITVSPGTRVTFVNSDTRNHEMNSDPHPTHGDCPAIDQVGFIAPNQSKQTGNLNTVRVCSYHDHNDPSNANLIGRIRVQ